MTHERHVRIVICFFGITRSLPYTLPSLRDHVLAPAGKLGEVKIYAHFFRENRIVNPRSGEDTPVSADDWQLLDPDWVRLEEPDEFLGQVGAEEIASYGDTWEDNGRSLRNLLHQLRSLDVVSREATANGPADLYIFCRPDLEYHDDFEPVLRGMLGAEAGKNGVVAVPNWQHWGGLNDRFAICSGAHAAQVYGGRLHQALEYCRAKQSPLHGENLLRYALQQHGVSVKLVRLRASRVRADGRLKSESFMDHRLLEAKMFFIRIAYSVYKTLGIARLRDKVKKS